MQSTKVLHVGTLSDNLDGLGITQVKLVLDEHILQCWQTHRSSSKAASKSCCFTRLNTSSMCDR